MWVWGTLPNGIQTIPRDMTYDPRTGKINYAPVEEMKQLRSSTPLATLPSSPLKPGSSVTLKASVASDIEVTLAKPSVAANITLDFAGGALFFQYAPGATTAQVGFAAHPGGATEAAIAEADESYSAHLTTKAHTHAAAGKVAAANLSTYMTGVDLGGHDMHYPNATGTSGCQHYPKGTQPAVCQQLCGATKGCGAWTYVIRGQPADSGDCCLKHDVVQSCPRPDKACTSGVMTPTTQCTAEHHGGGGGKAFSDVVSMLPSDTHVTFRLFLDTAVAEAYFMGGRVAMTIPVAASTTEWDISIGASAPVTLTNATSFGMSSIYVTKEEVLAMPKLESS
jgi:hypothetical protein